MYKVNKYPHATFCWGDCMSQDADKAKHFYPAVMGWEFEELQMDENYVYTQFKLEGENVAGMGQMTPDMLSAGIPSNWMNMVSVDDAEVIAAKASALGGTLIMPAMDVFEQGRMAMIQDPAGAVFGIWQPNSHIGAGLVNRPGAMCWNELATRDIEGAQKFYGELFGWTFGTLDESGSDYHMIYNNGRANGGMMLMDEKWGEIPPNWMIYFAVDDLDTAIEKVKANAGSLGSEVINASVGKMAVTVDPAGAHFYLIELLETDPWVE